jgi:hypothetical protein
MENELSGVYIMQTSNGLCKIGKANNPDVRRQQLEQTANMFNLGERITIRVVKFYPVISKVVAFALESYLHEHFSGCHAGTSSREIFIVDIKEVVKIADTWYHAFTVAQTIQYQDMLLKEADKTREIDSTFSEE